MTEFGRIDYFFLDDSCPGPDGKGRDDWQFRKPDMIVPVVELFLV
jgi:hypothetical protein